MSETARYNFRGFTYREKDLTGVGEKAIEQRLRENIRNREVFVKERSKGTRLSDFTYVVVSYRASATVATYIEGRLYQRVAQRILAVNLHLKLSRLQKIY